MAMTQAIESILGFMNDRRCQHLIHWHDDGRSFVIEDGEKLSIILRKKYTMDAHSNLIKNLCERYGFVKIDEDGNTVEDNSKGGSRLTGRWKHKDGLFVRNQVDLMRQITCASKEEQKAIRDRRIRRLKLLDQAVEENAKEEEEEEEQLPTLEDEFKEMMSTSTACWNQAATMALKLRSTAEYNLEMVDVEYNQNLAEVTKQSYDDITVAMTIIEKAFQDVLSLKAAKAEQEKRLQADLFHNDDMQVGKALEELVDSELPLKKRGSTEHLP